MRLYISSDSKTWYVKNGEEVLYENESEYKVRMFLAELKIRLLEKYSYEPNEDTDI